MITIEARNHLLGAGFKGSVQFGTWYVAPYRANYTPTNDDTAAATVPLLNESTAYSGATRVPVTFGTPAAASLDNTAAKVELTASAPETWRGVILISTSGKAQAAGVLVRVQPFTEPVTISAGSKLEVEVDIDLLNP